MGKLENLEKKLEAEESLNQRIKQIFENLPDFGEPLFDPKSKTFNVYLVKKRALDFRDVIRYEIVDSILQFVPPESMQGESTKFYKDVYIQTSDAGKRYRTFLSKKKGDSYQNVVGIDLYRQAIVFDRSAIRSMGYKQLIAFVYATNKYIQSSML